MYKNYIFDLYGTLIDINTDEGSYELFEKISFLMCYRGAVYEPTNLRDRYYALIKTEQKKMQKKHPDYKFVDVHIEQVFKKLYKDKGVIITDDDAAAIMAAFRSFCTKYIKLYDGVTDLLDELKKRGKKIYLLSNAQRNFTWGEIVMTGLEKRFDGILISSDEEVSKPDPKFYDILFKRYGLKKSESIMIGNDSVTDILGAKNYGIDSLYIHQSISPPITEPLQSKYKVLDGDVFKIKGLVLGKE
ncbi:MAG: HAD family hydrolase [Oscillospiraceae bacterium]|jgi:putative hydrolase of the HAD superfamily|nr:HAD family hydrolase [Oscillospiraceae bacterium]